MLVSTLTPCHTSICHFKHSGSRQIRFVECWCWLCKHADIGNNFWRIRSTHSIVRVCKQLCKSHWWIKQLLLFCWIEKRRLPRSNHLSSSLLWHCHKNFYDILWMLMADREHHIPLDPLFRCDFYKKSTDFEFLFHMPPNTNASNELLNFLEIDSI